MAVTNKDQDVSQDLILRVAISRGTALLIPELIEELQAVPDMLIASRVDEYGESDSKTLRGSYPLFKRMQGGTWV